MANVSVQTKQLDAGSLLEAMFPNVIRDGTVEIVELIRQCQYRAEAILEFGDGDRADTNAKRLIPDLVQGARAYIAAANALIDYVPAADVRVMLASKTTTPANPGRKVEK